MPAVVLVSIMHAASVEDISSCGARGFVTKADFASPELVELVGPP